jgi:hypothetical protein
VGGEGSCGSNNVITNPLPLPFLRLLSVNTKLKMWPSCLCFAAKFSQCTRRVGAPSASTLHSVSRLVLRHVHLRVHHYHQLRSTVSHNNVACVCRIVCSLSGSVGISACQRECCCSCFYLEPRICLKPFTIHVTCATSAAAEHPYTPCSHCLQPLCDTQSAAAAACHGVWHTYRYVRIHTCTTGELVAALQRTSCC